MNNLRRTLPVYNDLGSFIDNFFNMQKTDESYGDLGRWAPAAQSNSTICGLRQRYSNFLMSRTGNYFNSLPADQCY